MIIFIKRYLKYCILFFFLLSHICFIHFPSVNFESLFAFAGEYPHKIEKKDLDIYFHYQANTLGFSYIISFLKFFFPFVPTLIIGKLVSISGIIFLFYGLLNFFNKIEYKDNSRLIFLILFHPFIWTLSLRATPDFFAFATGMFALSFMYLQNSKIEFYVSIFFMSLSIIIKPHSVFFLIVFFILTFFNKIKINPINLFWQFFLILILTSFYYINNYYQFNFFVINNYFENTHSISFSNFLSNIILYFGFLGIIFFPLCVFFYYYFVINKDFKKLFLFFFTSLIFSIWSFFFINSTGEMDFGFISQYISTNLTNGILSFFAINLFLGFFIHLKKNEKFPFYFIVLSIVLLIFILSLSRPSQRYLIYLIPFCFFIYGYIIKKNIIFISTILIFFLLNFLISNNHYATAFSTNDIIKYLEKNNIDKHSVNYRHLFPHMPVTSIKSNRSKVEKLFSVQAEYKPNYIYATCRGLFLSISKCNYLVPIRN